MKAIYMDYLNRLDVEELAMTDAEILEAIETSLATQGRGETVIEPRVHLEPGVADLLPAPHRACSLPSDHSDLYDHRTLYDRRGLHDGRIEP